MSLRSTSSTTSFLQGRNVRISDFRSRFCSTCKTESIRDRTRKLEELKIELQNAINDSIYKHKPLFFIANFCGIDEHRLTQIMKTKSLKEIMPLERTIAQIKSLPKIQDVKLS